ncbi:MAG: DsbA family protein [Candidatus Riflebacteria bacterium]|nr:DsbA family protein [Candidatus Riflebacteria bacterium]
MIIDFKNPTIKFYFSFQCPYSYMAWEMLKKLLSDKVSLAPIEIGLIPPSTSKFHYREIWAEPRWNRLVKDAEKINIRISQPDKYASGINAARAIEAYGSSNAKDYITSVFQAVFFRHLDISLQNSLRQHLQSEGIDSSVLSAALEDPETEKKANDQLLLWGHERIRMVPSIELDEERYCGFIDQSGLERFLRSVLD